MNDAAAVALEFGARARRCFRIAAPARERRMRGIRREVRFERFLRREAERCGVRRGFLLYIVAAPVCHRVLRNMGGAGRRRARRLAAKAGLQTAAASVACTSASGAWVLSVSPKRFSRMNLIAPASAFLS